jgi:hypothetical protein
VADESGLQRDSEIDRDRRSSRDLRPGELVSRGVDRVRGYLGTHDKAEEAPRDDGPAPPRRTIDFASGSGSRERLDAAWDFEGAPPEPVAPDPNRDAIPEAGTLTPPGSAPEFVRDRLPLRENLERQGTSFRAVDLSRREGLTVRGAEHGAVCFALRGSARVWIGEREELLDNGGVVSFVGHEHVSIVADEHGTRILIVRKAQ